MTFLDPIWLLLLAPGAAALLAWKQHSSILNTLRAVVVILILIALSRPIIEWDSGSGSVVVVADRSASIAGDNLVAQDEVVRMLHESMGPRDSLAVISFAEQVALEKNPGREEFGGFQAKNGPDQSRLGEALEMALSIIPENETGRILTLTDGLWTGKPPVETFTRASSRGIPIDYRDLRRSDYFEIGIQSFDPPPKALPGQGFLINSWVYASRPEEVRYQLKRNETIISAGTQSLNTGANRLLFRDRAEAGSGLSEYTLEIFPSGETRDSTPENNKASALLQVQGPLPLLHISESSTQSGLARLLQAGGVDLVSLSPGQVQWNLESLADYAGIILENTSANDIGLNGMTTIASWIEETGKGLFMTGGRKSFGPGGYFQSPLDPLLPVSMEMRQEHRKFNLAIAVVLDRSGSMGAPVGVGRTKMDLANIGTVQVLDLLSAQDEIGVIAVDSSPHLIVDLDTVDVNLSQRNKILGIESMGGGIYVYEALEAASRMLMDSKSSNRHIILFSDAADSEEPGDYVELLRLGRDAGITVSVVGLGTEADPDADLLKDIAAKGDGNIYFTQDANEVPRLFAQDTFSVARSSMIEEPTPLEFQSSILGIGGDPDWNPPALGGYNLCYIKPQANQGAVTLDEYAAPVVATWQAGVGRVAAFTGEADGQYSGDFTQWESVGDFYATLARWVAGEAQQAPDGIWVTQELREGSVVVQMHLDPARQGDPFPEPPELRILRGDRGSPPVKQTHNFRWKDADTLEASIGLTGEETLIATVDFSAMNGNAMSLPPVRLPYSPEFKPEWTERGSTTLKDMARHTGGRERAELASIWEEIPRKAQAFELAPWALGIAAFLFFVEILERRMALLSKLNWNPRKVVSQSGMSDEQEEETVPAGKPSVLTSWLKKSKTDKPQKNVQPEPTRATSKTSQPTASGGPAVSGSKETKGSSLSAMKKARQKAQSRTRR